MNSIKIDSGNTKLKRNIIFLATIVIILCSFFQLSPSAKAESLWEKQGTFKDDVGRIYGGATPTDIRIVVVNAIKVFLGFLSIIFLILIILAGVRWMTAGGNEERVKESIAQLRNAVIGLIIILISYSITVFVMKVLSDKILKKM